MQQALDAILQIDILSPPREYVQQVIAALCAHLGYQCGVAFTVSSTGSYAVFAHHQVPDDPQPTPVGLANLADPGHGVERFLVATGFADSQCAAWAQALAAQQLHTVNRVPLRYQGRLQGIIELYQHGEQTLQTGECPFLSQIAEMVSVAIASNLYLEALHQRTSELQEEIARRERVELALREALRERKALEAIVNRSPVVVFLWRIAPGWPLEFVSRSIERFGYTSEELCAQADAPFLSLVYTDDLQRILAEITGYIREGDGILTLEYRVLSREGEIRWVETRIWGRRDTDVPDLVQVVTDTEPQGVITHLQGIMQDITERKHAEETIRHQAFHDTLTNLPNRVLFQDRLSLAIEHASRSKRLLAVMFLDLDRFKLINDTLGHAIGDQLLQAVAERVQSRLRAEDTVARLGGDEFTVLLPELARAEDAAHVAQSLLIALRMPFLLGEHTLHVSTSIGISLFPNDSRAAQVLLRNADTALYYAKEHGRDNFQFFSPSMNTRMMERLLLENQLREAIEREQFQLYYQPQLDIATGRIIGMESLVRWRHPELGIISPAQFIPLAEETGLIESIGQWVLGKACAQNKLWHDQGFHSLRVAVNLSARQFYQRDLPSVVERVLAETGIAPQFLELELTEGTTMRHVAYSVEMMRCLQAMGVRLSIDDFGVGHSSLMYLKQFPLDTLKIDKSFIHGLEIDPHDTAIATAIITMARSMQLQVIAEGVETESQLRFLRQSHCFGMQGFLFSGPLPAEDFDVLLRQTCDLTRV
ncbi:MAG TPA: EAL domain-containing protein [Armatimonadota bacterium]